MVYGQFYIWPSIQVKKKAKIRMEIYLYLVLNKEQKDQKHVKISTLADSVGVLLATCPHRSASLSDRMASSDSIPAYRNHCGCGFSVVQSSHHPPGQNLARSQEVTPASSSCEGGIKWHVSHEENSSSIPQPGCSGRPFPLVYFLALKEPERGQILFSS
jgi:hypothetical protein